MKFKRTIASILAATFSLTLMGQSAPRAFAEGESEVSSETSNLKSKEELQKAQEELNKKLKELDEQGKLDELKEKVKKLEKKLKKEKTPKKKEAIKEEKGYFSKDGIKEVLSHPFKIIFAGVSTFALEFILILIPVINIPVLAILSTCYIGVLLPFVSMLAKAIDLYDEGCKKSQN